VSLLALELMTMEGKPYTCFQTYIISGSSTNLELAIQLYRARTPIKNRVRFAWWGAEERGLLGSSYYVASLSDEEKSKIVLNLNFGLFE
jgi:Zn-dependent M28 family amino/carboxypeptidase